MATAQSAPPIQAVPPPPEPSILDELAEMVPRIQATLAEINERRSEVRQEFERRFIDLDRERRAALHELETEQRQLAVILKDLGVEPPKQRQRRAGSTRSVSVSPKLLVATIEAIEAWPEKEFTTIALHEVNGWEWSQAHTHTAIKALREAEFIRKVRQDGGRAARAVYAIFHRDVGERLKAQAQEALDAAPVRQRVTKDVHEVAGLCKDFITKHGQPVTVPELMEDLGLSSKSSAQPFRNAIYQLVEIGYLKKVPHPNPPRSGRMPGAYDLADESKLELVEASVAA